MNDFQVVMPFIAPKENLISCLESMGDIPVPLLIVDNSKDSVTKTISLPKNVEVEYHPEGLCVSASWNRGIDKGAKWTVICSASMRFSGRLTEFIEGCSKRASAYGLNPRMAMHLYIVGKATVDEIGGFDPNYKPIYVEDVDFWRRTIVAGITGCGTSEFPYYHPDFVSCAGDALALKSGVISVDFERNLRYFRQKWGGDPSSEKFTHPFNDETKPLSWYPKDWEG